jgi:hypothetical protein
MILGAQSQDNVRTAQIIGALPLIQRLGAADASQASLLRQQISEKVLAASLQIDATTAQIDNEIAQANELRGLLANRRDRTVNRANLFSVVIGGGLGAGSSALQLASGQARPASVVGIAAGVLSSGLAVSGILAQKGIKRVFDFDSNMLARLFERPALPDSDYAAIIWSFLNEVAPTDADHITRKERLIRTWIQVKRIDQPSTAAGKDKIERVTSRPAEKMRLTIDDLEDRAAMLEDVRAKLSFLKRDLASLVLSLPAI